MTTSNELSCPHACASPKDQTCQTTQVVPLGHSGRATRPLLRTLLLSGTNDNDGILMKSRERPYSYVSQAFVGLGIGRSSTPAGDSVSDRTSASLVDHLLRRAVGTTCASSSSSTDPSGHASIAVVSVDTKSEI